MLMFEILSVVRRFRAHPVLTGLNVIVLGVGLGSFLLLLSIVNGLIVQPLPFPHADRVVGIGYERDGNVGIGTMSVGDYGVLKRELHGYAAFGADSEANVFLDRGSGAHRFAGAYLSEDILQMLGQQPMLGRLFSAEDCRPGAQQVVILGEQTWRNEFGADPKIIGSMVQVNAEPAVVIGVLGGGFAYPTRSQVWLPLRATQTDADVSVVGVLPESTTLQAAAEQLRSSAAALGAELDGQKADQKLVLKGLKYRFVNESTRGYVWLMFGASLMVLLLAVANSINLQLGQLLNRRSELAVYSALGAGQQRLLREALLECLLLTVLATLIGLGAVQFGTAWIVSMFAANDGAPAYFFHLGLNGRMVGLSALVALGTALLAGMAPALWAARTDGLAILRDAQKGSTARGLARVAKALVIFEVMLSIVLLIGAGTFIKNLQRMTEFDTGVRVAPDHVLTAQLEYAFGTTTTPQSLAADLEFLGRLADELNGQSGVLGATLANTVPGATLGSHEYVGTLGGGIPKGGYQRTQFGVVDRYFAKTYGLELIAGRFFDERDLAGSKRPSVVVNKALAEALWPGRSAIGQQMILNPQRPGTPVLTVVGEVGPLHLDGPLEPRLPAALVLSGQFQIDPATIAVHVQGDAASWAPRLTRIVQAQRSSAAVFDFRSLERRVAARRSSLVVVADIFFAVGGLGLVMAATGLYGVLSFAVTQRNREIGIRRAIGASRGAIVRAVGGRLAGQVGVGLLLGLALAIPWAGMLARALMQPRAFEPSVFLATILVVLGSALLACSVPLARALRIDPMNALREE